MKKHSLCYVFPKRAKNGDRTRDLRVTSALLYQLSYLGVTENMISKNMCSVNQKTALLSGFKIFILLCLPLLQQEVLRYLQMDC